MTRRWQADDPEMQRTGTDDLPLFGPHASVGNARELARQGLELSESAHADLLDVLVPIAQVLAEQSPEGITVSDVRKKAYGLGLLTGFESAKRMSVLGALMKKAGLVPTGEYRSSDLDSTHARPQRVWRGK